MVRIPVVSGITIDQWPSPVSHTPESKRCLTRRCKAYTYGRDTACNVRQCTAYIVRHTLYGVHYTAYTLKRILYSVHYTAYTVSRILYGLQCKVKSEYGTLYTVPLWLVHCDVYALYSVQCTLYNVHCLNTLYLDNVYIYWIISNYSYDY